MVKTTTAAAPRLKALYNVKFVGELQAELKLGNISSSSKIREDCSQFGDWQE